MTPQQQAKAARISATTIAATVLHTQRQAVERILARDPIKGVSTDKVMRAYDQLTKRLLRNGRRR